MDLSEATTDGGSSAATSVARGGHRSPRETTMTFTITVNEAMFMPNDTPNAESILSEAYNIETPTVDETQNNADGLCHRMLPGGIN